MKLISVLGHARKLIKYNHLYGEIGQYLSSNDNTFTNIQDDKKTIMFGCVRNDNFMCLKNKIILFAKYYIYMCSCKQTKLQLKKIVLFVNFQIELDETAKLAGN